MSRFFRWVLLFIAAIFFVLHFFHLNADFPNNSPWMDWSKFTDEGWYGQAALRHIQHGNWYLAGGFNPGAALPIWPLIEIIWFRIFGPSLAAARACTVTIFGLICAVSWLLLYRWRENTERPRNAAPELAVLLLNVSPFCFVFFRLAVLEPALILFVLLALLIAGTTGHRIWQPIALGILAVILVLTKSTAVALFPAIAYLLWRTSPRHFLRSLAMITGVACVLGGAYILTIHRLHLSADVQHLFSINNYRINHHNAFTELLSGLKSLRWAGVLFAPLVIVAGAVSLRDARKNPLIPALLLWAGGYFAFIVFHANLQPRYYLVVILPLLLLLAHVAANPIQDLFFDLTPIRKTLGGVIALVLFVAAIVEARQTLGYVHHPSYTYFNAAQQIRAITAADPSQSPLVLSSSGSNLSLMTGQPIVDDGETMASVAEFARIYHPGWLVLWGPGQTPENSGLQPFYRVQEVARFHVMDDPAHHDPLILYRLTLINP